MFGRKSHIIKSLSDEEIIESFLLKEENILLSELYYRYSHLVLGTCMKYLKNVENSEDLTIQIFSDLSNNLKKYKINHFKSWLYTTTKNACFMILRKNNVTHLNYEEVDYHLQEEEETISSKEIMELKLNALDEAIGKLNDDQAFCIRSFYLNKKSYEEISINSEYTINQVKSHIQNGKRNLKIIILKITESI